MEKMNIGLGEAPTRTAGPDPGADTDPQARLTVPAA